MNLRNTRNCNKNHSLVLCRNNYLLTFWIFFSLQNWEHNLVWFWVLPFFFIWLYIIFSIPDMQWLLAFRWLVIYISKELPSFLTQFCGQRQYENKMVYLEWVSHFKCSRKLEPPGKQLAVLFKRPGVGDLRLLHFYESFQCSSQQPDGRTRIHDQAALEALLTHPEWLWVNLYNVEINLEKLSREAWIIPE